MLNKLKTSGFTLSVHPLLLLVLFPFLFLGVIDVRTLIFISVGFGILIYLLFHFTLLETMYLAFVMVLPFEKGIRDWLFPVVLQGAALWEVGYTHYFGISLKLIFAVAALLLFIFSKSKQQVFRYSPTVWFGYLFFGSVVLINLLFHASLFPIVGLIRLLVPFSAYVVGLSLFKQQKIRQAAAYIILGQLLLFSFVGILEMVQHHTIGIFLEDTAFSEPFGYFTTGGERFYRISSLVGHPTFLASLLTMLLPFSLGFLSVSKLASTLKPWVMTAVICITAIPLIGTVSRSGWIAGLCIVGIFLRDHFRVAIAKISGPFRFIMITTIVILVGLYVNQQVMLSRLQVVDDVMSVGNAQGRLDLVHEAVRMVTDAPFVGVGLNQFTLAMNQHVLTPQVRSFLYPVHNTFLLIFAENGVVAGTAFVVLFVFSLAKNYLKATKNRFQYWVWIGILLFGMNAQFHTLFNQDPTFDYLFLFLAFLQAV